jgi:hypothetical protein
MGKRTGVAFVDGEFVPWKLRRRAIIPIMTFAEMFGME